MALPAKRTDITHELIQSLEEAVAIAEGKIEPGRVHLAPDIPDVRAMRDRLSLTRAVFAERFGLEVEAVRIGEQGMRPDRAACVLPAVERAPDAVEATVTTQRRAAWRLDCGTAPSPTVTCNYRRAQQVGI